MLISRNPYAREELHGETIKTNQACDWCGQNNKRRLFNYYIEPDGILYKRWNIAGHFCSINCMRNYHC
jgi:hypothetical protein